MTEYVIILLLVAILAIPFVGLFGESVEHRYQDSRSAFADLDATGEANPSGGEDISAEGPGYEFEEEENPFIWDPDAQRWFDPASGFYVSFRDASRYLDDPFLYYEAYLEPGRR